ncbi:MAG: hypothetical protein PHH70_01035 [Candidatus Gracilibacteria bacterium]|nr:hypothetical protein [Candidatus Gracilibacteria bacterium]
MSKDISKKITPGGLLFTTLLIGLLVVCSVFLARNIFSAHRAGVFQDRKPIMDFFLNHQEPRQPSTQDIQHIETWMTFQYINFVFDMPPEYLKEALKIDDVHYPNLPIGRYIKSKKLDTADFLQQIKTATKTSIDSRTRK